MTTTDKLSSRKQTPLEAGDAYIATLADVPLAGGDTPLPGGVLHDGVSFSEGLIAGRAFEAATGRSCSTFGITAALAAAAVVRAAETDPEPRKASLTMEITGGKLVMSIGVEALAMAIEGGPMFEEGTVVIDHDVFAAEVLTQLQDEDEAGTNLIHRAFDSAFEAVAESGAEGVTFPEESY